MQVNSVCSPVYLPHSATANSTWQCFFQLINSAASKTGTLSWLKVSEFVMLSSVSRNAHLYSQRIWKNLLIHFNHGFLKTTALSAIPPTTLKVIYLQLTKLQISLETPHLVFAAGERGCKNLIDLLSANENKIYLKIEDSLLAKPFPSPKDHKAFTCALKEDLSVFKRKDIEEGWTPLLHASLAGDTDLVRALIAHHTLKVMSDKTRVEHYVNYINSEGYTALLYASTHGHLEIVRILLETCANVDEMDAFQSTPLIQATIEGHLSIVELLLEKGANVELSDPFGKTPLMHAAEEGQLEVLNLLLKHNANLNAKDPQGRTVGFYATYQQSKLATQSSEISDDHPDKPSLREAITRQTAIVDVLLEAINSRKEEVDAHSHKRRKL